MDVERNPAMFVGNQFKLAVFGSNCSSGRAVTMVPERWQNTFAENIRLAHRADAAGIEALVPIGRWKGYGGLLAVGDPDTVAGEIKHLAEAGFDGFCFSFVAYNDELPYFVQEVLPRLERMGLRQKQR